MNANRRHSVAGWLRVVLLLLAALALASCTTFIRPVKCEGGPYKCDSDADIKFCEYEVVAALGTDCAELGLAASRRFCVVAPASCVDTHYKVKGHDCDVIQYRTLREWRVCSPGTPTFDL